MGSAQARWKSSPGWLTMMPLDAPVRNVLCISKGIVTIECISCNMSNSLTVWQFDSLNRMTSVSLVSLVSFVSTVSEKFESEWLTVSVFQLFQVFHVYQQGEEITFDGVWLFENSQAVYTSRGLFAVPVFLVLPLFPFVARPHTSFSGAACGGAQARKAKRSHFSKTSGILAPDRVINS